MCVSRSLPLPCANILIRATVTANESAVERPQISTQGSQRPFNCGSAAQHHKETPQTWIISRLKLRMKKARRPCTPVLSAAGSVNTKASGKCQGLIMKTADLGQYTPFLLFTVWVRGVRLCSGPRPSDSAQVQGSDSAQVQGSDSAQVQGSDSAQVQGSDSARVQVSDSAQVQGLHSAQVTSSDSAQVQGSDSAQVQVSDSAQVQGLHSAQVTGSDSAQVTGSDSAQVQGSDSSQVQGSDSAQVPDLQGLLRSKAFSGFSFCSSQHYNLTGHWLVFLTLFQPPDFHSTFCFYHLPDRRLLVPDSPKHLEKRVVG
ncbi:hypothetical protein WMY93_018780 [Mugilogobius chulae]|uniref:Uncharacterized protein n=1 Tax=Mugilogobius chulae TaxID=88201 RepID=A0AAW0NWN0_9GOBI